MTALGVSGEAMPARDHQTGPNASNGGCESLPAFGCTLSEWPLSTTGAWGRRFRTPPLQQQQHEGGGHAQQPRPSTTRGKQRQQDLVRPVVQLHPAHIVDTVFACLLQCYVYIHVASAGGPHIRPYQRKYARNHQNLEAKRVWAGLVLGLETTGELPVLYVFARAVCRSLHRGGSTHSTWRHQNYSSDIVRMSRSNNRDPVG